MKKLLNNTRSPNLFFKIDLKMKLSAICILATLFSLQAHNSYSQKKISLNLNNVPMERLLDEIENRTDFNFVYKTEDVDLKRMVSVNVNQEKIISVLDRVFSGTRTVYTVVGQQILLTERKSEQAVVLRAQKQVRGTVTDQKGTPIPGVNVFVNIGVEDIGDGVATDFEGKYTIAVTPGETLTFSHVSFVSRSVLVEDQTTIDVTLEELYNELEGVVITGYQKIESGDNAGAFAKADMSTVQNRSTSMNVLDRIDGLVPGVVINQSPSDEEGVDNSVLVRGLTTINANRQPLFVVDGVPINNISRINPRDIEDITVLKDASASAVYGSRAANGVIVITTKKGKVNSKIQFDYDTFINFQGKPDLDYIPTLTSRQFIDFARAIFDPVLNPYGQVSNTASLTDPGVPPHEQILYDLDNGLIDQATAERRLDALASFNNTNQIKDLWYRDAMLNNHTISASGGTEKHTFYSSLTYTRTEDNMPGNNDNTFKININQDFKFNSKLKVGLVTDLTQRITSGKRALTIDNRTLPYLRFRDEQENNLSMPYMQTFSRDELPGFESASGIDLDYNPLDEYDRGYDKGRDFQARITASLNWELLEGLEFQGLYGYVRGNGKVVEYNNPDNFVVRLENATMTQPATSPEGSPIHHIPLDGGHYYEENGLERNWVVRNQLNFNREWDHKHRLNILVGQEAQEQLTTVTSSFTRAFDDQSLTFPSLDLNELSTTGIGNPVIAQDPFGRSYISIGGERAPFRIVEDRYRFSSYYGTLNYTLNHKYVINGSGRIDRSNLFGRDQSAQNKPVWSAGFKWLLGNEDFLNHAAWLDNLGLRATYGLTGNAPSPGTASSYDILSSSSSSLFNRGYEITTPGNPDLTWESTRTLNLGVDFGFFNEHLSGSIDYYIKKTENLIGFVPTNSFTGYSGITGNFGDIENEGLEIMLKTLNINTGNFSWYTQFILGYNQNQITRLNQQVPIVDGSELIYTRYLEGYSAFSLFAYDFVGLDEMGDPQIRLADGSTTKMPFGTTVEDMKYMGTYQPKWSGGFSNSFSYGNFTLNANIIYNLGHVMRLDSPNPFIAFSGGRLIADASNNFTSGNLHPDILNRWRQAGDEAVTNVPSYVAERAVSQGRRNIDYYTYGDINVASASYVKLRDISLNYRFPESLLDQVGFDSFSLRVQLSNLMLWKKNKAGIDPEFHNLRMGRRSVPINQKSITFGLHLSI
ncbi:SusC/RagA family TonB-linked outer membrane protein [Sinomicrobium kalidii]|uniref:SusC/RagA family TonB-linked outer membrane protein n=1 Tax=Sinomicrobium kalidii TaxID=2900738 RepID=UPI001E3B2919|nr:SusC/RagA family TonB-linked outer membrane protein [Sinomicrobium kalidii]UGU15472.1 SusC/RagA family TonB-linked outer membrane protein [Sinomicrobium kalidii]